MHPYNDMYTLLYRTENKSALFLFGACHDSLKYIFKILFYSFLKSDDYSLLYIVAWPCAIFAFSRNLKIDNIFGNLLGSSMADDKSVCYLTPIFKKKALKIIKRSYHNHFHWKSAHKFMFYLTWHFCRWYINVK